MKLLSRKISNKDASGDLLVVPELTADIWHLYNLISPGDVVTMSTVRKVKSEGTTGTVRSTKQRLRLSVKVKEQAVYDASTSTLRISGQNVAESSFVKMGAYHTFTLGLNDSIKLSKDRWDHVHLERIRASTDVGTNASLAAVVMQQDGLGHVCLITEHMTVTKAKVQTNIPKKRSDRAWSGAAQEKQVTKFYRKLYDAVAENVDFEVVKCLLVGGPGFVAGDWVTWVWEEAKRKENKNILDNKDRFCVVKASSGHKHAIDEVLADPNIANLISDTKVARDVKVLEKFLRMLDDEPSKAWYGFKHVRYAAAQGAVDTLLITDDVIRCAETLDRRAYVKLVEEVQQQGGMVSTFSGMHLSGKRLQQVCGIAAVLRFPMEEPERLEDMDVEDEVRIECG